MSDVWQQWCVGSQIDADGECSWKLDACGSRIGRPSSPDQQAQQVEAATTSGVTACETKAWHEAARNCCGSERIGYAGQDFSSRPAD